MTQQISIDFTAARRDAGIQRAADHAEREAPGWGEGAVAFVQWYARHNREFLAEDVIESYIRVGLPEPPDGRAWGAVIRRAAKLGAIQKAGYRPARSSNLSPKVLWRSLA